MEKIEVTQRFLRRLWLQEHFPSLLRDATYYRNKFEFDRPSLTLWHWGNDEGTASL